MQEIKNLIKKSRLINNLNEMPTPVRLNSILTSEGNVKPEEKKKIETLKNLHEYCVPSKNHKKAIPW